MKNLLILAFGFSLLAVSVSGQVMRSDTLARPYMTECPPGYMVNTGPTLGGVYYRCVPDPRYWTQLPDDLVRIDSMWTMIVTEKCDTVEVWREVEYSLCLGSNPLQFVNRKALVRVADIRCGQDTIWDPR